VLYEQGYEYAYNAKYHGGKACHKHKPPLRAVRIEAFVKVIGYYARCNVELRVHRTGGGEYHSAYHQP
jgi:hypothetical protein